MQLEGGWSNCGGTSKSNYQWVAQLELFKIPHYLDFRVFHAPVEKNVGISEKNCRECFK